MAFRAAIRELACVPSVLRCADVSGLDPDDNIKVADDAGWQGDLNSEPKRIPPGFLDNESVPASDLRDLYQPRIAEEAG